MGILDGHETPYEALKTLQQVVRLGRRGRKPPIKDLIVLSPQKDPFYAGTEAQQAMAEWFADVFGQNHRRASEAYPLPFGGSGGHCAR